MNCSVMAGVPRVAAAATLFMCSVHKIMLRMLSRILCVTNNTLVLVGIVKRLVIRRPVSCTEAITASINLVEISTELEKYDLVRAHSCVSTCTVHLSKT